MRIKKAIIPVAGWGTRRLPITKSIEKAMLPIGNRPIIDYVVEDCAKAGIEDIYIVIDERPNSQIEAYYRDNDALNEYLSLRGKVDKLPLARTGRPNIQLHFVPQCDVNHRYGNALPVAQVVEQFNISEPTVVLMGDDFSYNADGSSDLVRMLDLLDNPNDSALLTTEVPLEEVEKYGVLIIKDNLLSGFYEKPKKTEAPSNLINISKYVMSPRLLQRIVEYCHTHDFGPQDQEFLITDPIIEHIKAGEKMHVLPIQGEYLDGGSLEGWLHANNVVCKSTH
ncbi:hypothetical protein IKF15_03500 [Candidatus Saccharibacteria bacterium]|nr:hypothetical protein [Candidatus Saccharibacteria bacterium]